MLFRVQGRIAVPPEDDSKKDSMMVTDNPQKSCTRLKSGGSCVRWLRFTQAGATMVEFAIAFPIFLMILAAAFDYGYLFLYRSSLLREKLFWLTNYQTSLEYPSACQLEPSGGGAGCGSQHECILEAWCRNSNRSQSGLRSQLAEALGTSRDLLTVECEWRGVIDVPSLQQPEAPFALHVRVEWQKPCLFCEVLPSTSVVTARTASVIEGCYEAA